MEWLQYWIGRGIKRFGSTSARDNLGEYTRNVPNGSYTAYEWDFLVDQGFQIEDHWTVSRQPKSDD